MIRRGLKREKIWFKGITMAVMCLFLFNSVSWAMVQPIPHVDTENLQVQTMFRPIEKVADIEHRTQVRFESRTIMAMALEGGIPLEMNAFLDESCSAQTGRKRMLDVINREPAKDGTPLTVEFKLIRGKNKGTRFKVSLFCEDLGELSEDQEKLKIDILLGEKEDSRESHGLIARGDPSLLANALKEQIRSKSGVVKKANILSKDIFREEIKELKQIAEDTILKSAEKEKVYAAIKDLASYDKVRFDAIVLDPVGNSDKANGWLLGFNSISPLLKQQLKPILPRPTLGYADQALLQLKGNVLLEYLLHEPLCQIAGHYEARKIQEKLFNKANYYRSLGGPGRMHGALAKFLSDMVEVFLCKTNRMYLNAKIDKNGKRRGGTLIWSCKNTGGLKSRLKDHPDYIIENIRLGNKGGLTFNGKTYWEEREGYGRDRALLEVKKHEVVEAYDLKGKNLYSSEMYHVYIGGKIGKDGKRIGGEFIGGAQDKKGLNVIVKGYSDYIVENVGLNSGGGLKFNGRSYWQKKEGYENKKVTIVVKNQTVIQIYDDKGEKIYPHKFNHVYTGGRINKKGEMINGTFVGSAENKKGLNGLIRENPDCIIKNVELSRSGGLSINGVPYWHVRSGCENEIVVVVVEKGKVKEVYDEKGIKIYPHEINKVYVGAVIGKEGKRQGGELVGVAKDKAQLKVLTKQHKDCIVENAELTMEGGLTLNRKNYWRKMAGYEGAKVTLVIEKNKVKEVYDEKGTKIYPFNKDDVYRVYAGGSIGKNGNRRGGKLIGAVRDKPGVNSLIRKNPDCIVENVDLDIRGGLQVGGKFIWRTMKGYEQVIVTLVIEKGEVKEVWDKEGTKIYPFPVNHIYLGATIKKGKRQGGKLVCAIKDKRGLTKELAKYPNCIVENMRLHKDGKFKFNGKLYHTKLDRYDGKGLATVKSLNDRAVEVFDQAGNQIYQERENKGIEVFNRLWENGDLEKLMEVFGPEGTNRILLSFFDSFTPKTLFEYNKKFFKSLSRIKRDKVRDRKKVLPLSEVLEKLNSVKLFIDEEARTDHVVVVEELVKQIYIHLVKDSRFLEEIEKMDRGGKISPFLRKCYLGAVKYYRGLGAFEPIGIQKTTELKFYQKMGIKFILDKKKVLLADVPGLGKTLQALGAACNAYNGKGARKVLIICPNISKDNVWKKQIEEHLRGEQEMMIVNKRKALDSVTGRNKAESARFIMVNYELLRGPGGKHLREKIKELGIDFIIADEAHQMRGDSQTAEAVREFDAPYKVLVTGTPLVGRKPSKLFNLLNWMYPERYPNRKEFSKTFNVKNGGIKDLRNEIKSYMMRRYMMDVMSEMSDLKVQVRPVRMSKPQANLYRKIEKKIYEDNTFPLIGQISQLKRAAIDTALIRRIRFIGSETESIKEVLPGAHDIVIDKVKYSIIPGENGDFTLIYDSKKGKIEKEVVDGEEITLRGKKYKIDMKRRTSYSAKYDELDTIVDDVVKEKQEKIVVFTGAVRAVKDLEARYVKKGYKVKVMYGEISQRKRETLIADFNKTKEPELLICTYQTGGESIDLTGASYGVLVDEPWTAQEKDQIIRRLYRLGQGKEVNFYVLQSMKTIDERIEEVLAEGEFLQRVILDDPVWNYSGQDEIIKRFMENGGNGGKDLAILKAIQKKTRSISEEADKTTTDREVFCGIEEKGRKIEFSGGSFKVKLFNNKKEGVSADNVPELLLVADKLDKVSKNMAKEFFLNRLTAESGTKIKVKDMILWQICTELIPGFKHIDYHGKLELVVETGTYVLRRIIEDPDLEMSALFGELDGVSEKLFEETMYYLDSSNILKFFSMVGVLPQAYYYKGELLKYTPPINVYYDRNGVQYYDEAIVKNIAPGWRVPENNIPEGLHGFEREKHIARKLTRPEEIRLAHQLELGNKAAEVVIVMSYLRKIPAISKRIKRYMINLFGTSLAENLDLDELCDIGRNELVDLVRRYAQLGAYEEQPLAEYMKKRLNSRMYSGAFKLIKELKELTADDGAYGNRNEGVPTRAEVTSVDAVGASRLEEEEMINIMRQLLETNGFAEFEADIAISYIYGGYPASELLRSEEEKPDSPIKEEEDIEDIIDRFQSLMKTIGEEGIRQILKEGINDAEGENIVAKESIVAKKQKKTGEKEKNIIKKKIRAIHTKSRGLWEQMGARMIEQVNAPDKDLAKGSVFFEIDTALISKKDIAANIETLAYIVLLCREIKNVHFIFGNDPSIIQGKELPQYLAEEVENAPGAEEVINMLSIAVTEKAIFLGEDEAGKISDMVNKRIKTSEDPGVKTAFKERTVRVPIISKQLAEWARDNDVALDPDQFPVVMEGLTLNDAENVPLRDFESAVIVGLAKASLVIADRKTQSLAEKDKKAAKEEFVELKKIVLLKLNELYGVARGDGTFNGITEAILDYMIDPEPVHRLNRAIDLYLPLIIRMPVNMLTELHIVTQDFLYSL